MMSSDACASHRNLYGNLQGTQRIVNTAGNSSLMQSKASYDEVKSTGQSEQVSDDLKNNSAVVPL